MSSSDPRALIGAAGTVGVGGTARRGEGFDVQPGGKVWTRGGDDNHPGLGAGVNVLDDLGQLVPEFGTHAVSFLRSGQHDVRDPVVNGYLKTFVGHVCSSSL